MADPLLHLLPAAGGVLLTQHVCGGGGGELPPVPAGTGEGGESSQGYQASKEKRGQAEK